MDSGEKFSSGDITIAVDDRHKYIFQILNHRLSRKVYLCEYLYLNTYNE